jgi:hypothetical protein
MIAALDHHWLELFIAFMGALGGIVGGAVSGVLGLFVDWFLRPKLRIEFVSEEDGFIFDGEWKEGGETVYRKLVRLRVSNSGRSLANNSRVFLREIREVHGSATVPTAFNSAEQLSWPGWKFDARPLYRDVPLFVDLVFFDKLAAGWLFRAERLSSHQRSLRDYKGTLEFHVAVAADNSRPIFFKLRIYYNGDLKMLRILP